MARMVKEQEHAEKRRDILDAVLRLIYTKGYERMTIQDILEDCQISSGAFYHYFDSKPAVLEAFIERMQVDTEKPLVAIVQDTHLTAIEKLQRFFGTLDQLRITHKASIIELLRVWYTDGNAIVRQKVDDAIFARRAPLLRAIVHQGLSEGIFTTAFPDQASGIILSLLQGMATTHAGLMLSLQSEGNQERVVAGVVAVHAAYMDAIERVLGAPQACLYRNDAAAVQMWVAALRGGDFAG